MREYKHSERAITAPPEVLILGKFYKVHDPSSLDNRPGFRVPFSALGDQFPASLIRGMNGTAKEDAYFVTYTHSWTHENSRLLVDMEHPDFAEEFDIRINLLILDFDRKQLVGDPKADEAKLKRPWTTRDEAVCGLNAIKKAWADAGLFPSVMATSKNGIRAAFILSEWIRPAYHQSAVEFLVEKIKKTCPWVGWDVKANTPGISERYLVDSASKNWVQPMRVPFGLREGVEVSKASYAFCHLDLEARLDPWADPITPRDRSRSVSPKRVGGYTKSDLPMPEPDRSVEPTPVPIRGSRNTTAYVAVMKASEENPYDSLESIFRRIEPVAAYLDLQRGKADERKQEYRVEMWGTICKYHEPKTIELPPPVVEDPLADDPESVGTKIALTSRMLTQHRGGVLVTAAPGASKTEVCINAALTSDGGAVWFAPSRHLRDATVKRFLRPGGALESEIGVRLSNEEIFASYSTEEFAARKAAEYSELLAEAKKALYLNQPVPNTSKVRHLIRRKLSKDDDSTEDQIITFFEWLAKEIHGPNHDRRIITDKTLMWLKKKRVENDAEIKKSFFVFATHDALPHVYSDFVPEDWEEELEKLKQEAALWKSYGVEGMDGTDKAEKALERHIARNRFSDRTVVWDEVAPDDFINPEKTPSETALEIYGNVQSIKLFEAWDKPEKQTKFEILKKLCSRKGTISEKVIFLTADKGIDLSAKNNGFELKHLDCSILTVDRDFYIFCTNTKHPDFTDKQVLKDAMGEEVVSELEKAWKRKIGYADMLDAWLEKHHSPRAKISATLAELGLEVICSGKKFKADRESKSFLSVVKDTPLAPLNQVNVVGSNDHLGKRMSTVASKSSPDALGALMVLCDLKEPEAQITLMANAADQAIGRNVGCRGTPFVVAWRKRLNNVELWNGESNLHILVTPTIDFVPSLSVLPPRTNLVTDTNPPPPSAPEIVKRVYTALFKKKIS